MKVAVQQEKAGDVRPKSSEGWSLSVTQKSALHDTQHHGAPSYQSYTFHGKLWIAQLKVNETTHLESLSQKLKFRGFIPFGAWAEAKRKAKTVGLLDHQLRTKCARQGFHTFYPHAGSLASAEERQKQPASAGFFLLAVSTGANLAWSTKRG